MKCIAPDISQDKLNILFSFLACETNTEHCHLIITLQKLIQSTECRNFRCLNPRLGCDRKQEMSQFATFTDRSVAVYEGIRHYTK